jgi:hypothetical protein
MTPLRVAVAGGLLWSATAVGVAQQPVPRGDEFQVDTPSAPSTGGSVRTDAAGNFVVAWSSPGVDGDLRGIVARRFDASGNPQGQPFLVNTYTTGTQHWASVAVNGSGEFVVVWQSRDQDGSYYGIFGQRYDAAGNPQGTEFRVTVATLLRQQAPSVGIAGDGRFVVVWYGYTQGGAYRGIFSRRFDALGNPQGPDYMVSRNATYGAAPDVAMNASGEFVVAWHGGLGPSDLRGRRFDADGSPLGAEFVIDSGAGSPRRSSVGITADGAFAVAWERSFEDVWARAYDTAGAAGAQMRVNSYTTNTQGAPALAMSDDGSFVVVWESRYQEGEGRGGIYGQAFDPAATPVGSEFHVNAYTTGTQFGPTVAHGPDDSFVVVWGSTEFQGAGRNGTFARRFATPQDLIFADGFESGDLSAWSAAQTDGGDLGVSAAAAMASTGMGLQAVVDDQAGLFVQDDSPVSEGRYRARFYLDPTGYDPGESSLHLRTRVFLAFADAPLKRLVQVVLRRMGGQYSLAASVRLDDDTVADVGFTTITAAPHVVEVDWRRATAPGANDGGLELWIDGTPAGSVTALDNDQRGVDFVRLGALSVKAGAAGTLRFDEFVSRRYTYIGPS